MPDDWTALLEPEDLAFVKQFVIASGSLKSVARVYGVSYPTLRLRLDRLIQKIRLAEELRDPSSLERCLHSLYADGKLDERCFQALLDAHDRDRKESS